MSTIKVDTIKNTSNVEVFTAKAWVNFNGTGTVAIRASGNVSSITDNGVGNYTVNFTTAMVDVNYGVQTSSLATASNAPRHAQYNTQTTGSVVVYCIDTAGGVADPTSFSVSVFR
jgi:hypothetical protein